MKKDYKISEKISVIKIGMFHGLSGVILSNNKDTGFKPLSIILDNNLGVWQMNYEDVEPFGTPKSICHKDMDISNNKIENLTVATKPEKRKYQKRTDKAKEVKPKRKYQKKGTS